MAVASSARTKNEDSTRKVRGRANSIDAYVGNQLRTRRTLLGYSQQKLGDALDLTFQQVQKYESGANRMGASRLFQMAQVLDVPVSYFFENLPESEIPTVWSNRKNAPKIKREVIPNVVHKRETLELVRAYYQIINPKQRKRIYDLVKTLGDAKG